LAFNKNHSVKIRKNAVKPMVTALKLSTSFA